MNNIKFIKPVYPDDELHLNVEDIDKKAPKNETGFLWYCYLLSLIRKKKFLWVT